MYVMLRVYIQHLLYMKQNIDSVLFTFLKAYIKLVLASV